MRIVVVSDLHADKETLGVPRAPEVERALGQAVTYSIRTNADAFLFLGDLTDPDGGGATLQAQAIAIRALRALDAQGKRSIWIAGNHDVVEDGSGATTLSPLAALADESSFAVVIERPDAVWIDDGVRIVCLPYAPVARAYEPAREAKRLLDGAGPKGLRQIVAAHLSIPGIAPGEETTEMARGREVVFPLEETVRATLRLNGHYHARQDFDPGDGGVPIHVPGSPAAYAFGEHDNIDPAFSVIEL
jgi:DNA repair exonuclease SbcCD nuclease subunit